MQNILILADGHYAERFLARIAKRRVGKNHYVVVTPRPLESMETFASEYELHLFDPTSALKLSKLLYTHTFDSVFILMNSDEEVRACWDNVRAASESIEIILLDQWGAFSVLEESATHVVDAAQLIANRLYDHLPNVPVVAQNVGLAQGEIMEVMVPYGSPFAYRHVGSIAQVKWRIAAVYREGRQILPTHATMIRPQDTLLILGKPAVLENVYRRISQNAARFPEPFGRHLYLILDLDKETEVAEGRLQESIHLLERLEDNRLYVRLIRPGDFALIESLRAYEKNHERIEVVVEYEDRPVPEIILEDVTRYDVGLVMMDDALFGCKGVAEEMQAHKKLVLLFGDTPLYGITRLVVMMSEDAEMESISSTLFYAAETLELKPCLCQYDPEGDFEAHRRVVEHYEMLAKIFQYPIKVEQKVRNPIRALEEMEQVLQVVPFTPRLYREDLFRIFSTRLSDYLLETTRHPKLLIPAEEQ